jgi:hypothetical protein
MKKSDDMMACLGVVIGFILIPLIAIFQGWVLTVLWGWFVVPTFRAPELSIPVAIGLTLIIGMFKGYDLKTQEKSTDDKLVEAIATVAVPLVFLFLGWIVQLFM